MYLISAEEYTNAGSRFLKIKKTNEIWASMKDVGSGIGIKNISDLVLKEIYVICETKNPTEEKIKNHKMTERESYKKFDNLSKDELNAESNKNVYVKNNIITNIIKHCRGEKKKKNKRNRRI